MNVIHPRSTMHRNTVLAGFGLIAAIGLAACGGAGAAAPSPTGTTTASASSESGSSATGDAATVNANTATVEQLQAAFEAAGIPNADRWAREVAEYRPYPSDPTWAQLRHELGKYNIDPAVLEQIIAVLEV